MSDPCKTWLRERCRLTSDEERIAEDAWNECERQKDEELERLKAERDNLAMMVRRLVHMGDETEPIRDQAEALLRRYQLAGSPLRTEEVSNE